MKIIQAISAGEYYRIEKLIDMNSFADILEGYYRATGIPNGLVGPEGELLTQAGWIDACTRFHRCNAITNQHCIESNCYLIHHAPDMKVSYSLCKNGLYDYATPIMVEGHHLATLFMGQLLHEAPDLEFFEKKAEEHSFDKSLYIEAIKNAPVITKENVEKQLEHMVHVATVMANNALSTIRESKLEKALTSSTQRQIEMQDLLDNSPTGISWCDENGNIEYVNKAFTQMLGYTLDDIPDLKTYMVKAYPDPLKRKQIHKRWLSWVNNIAIEPGADTFYDETTIQCKDGTTRRIISRVSQIGLRMLYNCADITQKWVSQNRDKTRNRILERTARGDALHSVLERLVLDIEQEDSSMRCSILLLDPEGKHLFKGAAPSLPDFYNDAINGVEIGEGVGSCGTATYLGRRVIVEDIMTHEYWTPYRDLAAKAGLKACWSEPIFDSRNNILGSFAIYYGEPKAPEDADIERISFAANLASIVIENRNNAAEILKREKAYRSLAENAPDAIARYNNNCELIYTNPNFQTLFSDNSSERDNQLEHYYSIIHTVIEKGIPQQVEVEISTPSGFCYYMFNIVKEEGAGALAIGRDITIHRQMEQKLEKQARSDYLTQLVNRRHFFELANRELLVASRYHYQITLIMFDLDHFKQINDTYGHAIGDLVLQKIADVSLKTVREIDIVARLGGEEFVILQSQIDAEDACQTAERLRKQIANATIRLNSEQTISVTASFGVATASFMEGDSHTINDLISEADKAMYLAKEQGRNRVCR